MPNAAWMPGGQVWRTGASAPPRKGRQRGSTGTTVGAISGHGRSRSKPSSAATTSSGDAMVTSGRSSGGPSRTRPRRAARDDDPARPSVTVAIVALDPRRLAMAGASARGLIRDSPGAYPGLVHAPRAAPADRSTGQLTYDAAA